MIAWNWLDVVLAAVVLVSVIAAARKGFIWELISLGGVVVGLILAALYYRRSAVWFQDLMQSHEVALGAGFLAIFLGTLLAAGLVSALLRKIVKTVGIQWADRLLGVAFGLIRGLVVDCILLLILVAFAIKPESVRKSLLAPYVTMGARVIALAMPSSLKQQFRAGFNNINQGLVNKEERTNENYSGALSNL